MLSARQMYPLSKGGGKLNGLNDFECQRSKKSNFPEDRHSPYRVEIQW